MLRRDYRISAHEAEHEIPVWEREMLVRHSVAPLARAAAEESEDGGADPFSSVPEELRALDV